LDPRARIKKGAASRGECCVPLIIRLNRAWGKGSFSENVTDDSAASEKTGTLVPVCLYCWRRWAGLRPQRHLYGIPSKRLGAAASGGPLPSGPGAAMLPRRWAVQVWMTSGLCVVGSVGSWRGNDLSVDELASSSRARGNRGGCGPAPGAGGPRRMWEEAAAVFVSRISLVSWSFCYASLLGLCRRRRKRK
jgi:hypothetical protein